jgi:CRISPR-associated protein Csb2
MSTYLCLTVRFLQPYYHGRGDGDALEWPPSPLRLLQALVEAAARSPTKGFTERAWAAIRWLEQQRVPELVAAVDEPASSKYRLYVPSNLADKVAKSWQAGREGNIGEYRTEKDVRPTRLAVDEEENSAAHFLYSLPGDACPHFDVLRTAARSITHLGWGVDMVAGDAQILTEQEVAKLTGERWFAASAGGSRTLRAPVSGTLDALLAKHQAFLDRMGPDGNFRPVPPLTAFRSVGYRRSTDPPARDFVAFKLLKEDLSGPRAFDTVRRTREVAGMVRHAVARLAENDPFWARRPVNEFIHGKTADGGAPARGVESPNRFFYLPLPTIAQYTERGRQVETVGAVRRLAIVAPAECAEELAWARRALSGEDLRDDSGSTQAILTLLPKSDAVLQNYLGPFDRWSTVTPVLLPRHHGYAPDEAAEELRKAFVQAGYARDLVDQLDLEWRRAGFRAGVGLASKYLPPENLANKPRYHVMVKFPHPVPGPFAIGSGRFRGFGLFAKAQP